MFLLLLLLVAMLDNCPVHIYIRCLLVYDENLLRSTEGDLLHKMIHT